MPTAPALALAHVERIHASDSGRFLLEVDAFGVRRGEAVALTGPSGAGKSTMLDLLALASRPSSAGRFVLATREGVEVDVASAWDAEDLDLLTRTRAVHVGYVLQQGGLLPFLTLRENMRLAQRVGGKGDRARIEDLARRLGIGGLLDRKPATLSVGQRQRAAIARALAHGPEIVLADEPTASVHPALADTVLALLVEQVRAADAALVIATHDPDRAARHGIEICAAILAEDGIARSRFSRPAGRAA